MVDEETSNAYTEVISVLKYLNEEDYNKIPNEYIEVLNKNANPNHKFKFNPKLNFDEQNMSFKARYIIAVLFKRFGATEEQKEKIQKLEEAYNIELGKRYKKDNIFDKKSNENKYKDEYKNKENNDTSKIVEYKENLIQRLINFIKRIKNGKKGRG